jgi:uncharacterized protein (DUF1800 family)
MLPKARSEWTIVEAAHLLNRAGFGGSPDEIRTFHAMGRERAVDHVLKSEDAPGDFPKPEWAGLERFLADSRERIVKRRELMLGGAGKTAEQKEELRRQFQREIQQENRRQSIGTQGWWFRRMVRTKAPLREKMTLFWHDHFASSLQKVREPYWMLEQNELFREHALGSFHELTRQIVVNPAMMIYLDLQRSQKSKPNENFAREVMELFTLGEGNYTEGDIREAARAFTGYSIDRREGRAVHNRRQWDDSEKKIFGKTGNFDGQGVVDVIFEQPAVAGFLVRKLWEFFVYENPSQAAVDALSSGFRKSGYRIAPVLREIFLSQEFYSESAIRSQIKSPVQFLVQMIKQLEIDPVPEGFPILAQQQLGQTLFLPPNVAGWDWGQAWINTNTLLARYNIAGFLTKGSAGAMAGGGGDGAGMMMRGAEKAMARRWDGPDYEAIAPRELRKSSETLVDDLLFRFFQGPVPANARGNFIEYADAKRGAVFTNQEVGELCHLMLSTPYYQLF